MLFAKTRQSVAGVTYHRSPCPLPTTVENMIAPLHSRQYRYYDFVMAAYVCVLLCSNLIGPAKETSIEVPIFGAVTFLAGVLFFPISYIFGDILTEVYGYGRDRRVVWAGFGALAFASFMAWVVIRLPPAKSDFMAAY